MIDAWTPTIDAFYELRSAGRLVAPAVRVGVSVSDNAFNDATRAASLFTGVVRLEGCPVLLPLAEFLTVQPCGGVGVGLLYGAGRSVAQPQSSTSLWLDATLVIRLRATFGATFFELSGGAVVPITEPNIQFATPFVAIHQVPDLGALFAFGAGVRFP